MILPFNWLKLPGLAQEKGHQIHGLIWQSEPMSYIKYWLQLILICMHSLPIEIWFVMVDIHRQRVSMNVQELFINVHQCIDYVLPLKGRGTYCFWCGSHQRMHRHMHMCRHAVSGVQDISRTTGWILIKFAWILHWDRVKNWLGFGDLGIIFKVTAVLNRSNFGQIAVVCSKSYEILSRFLPNLHV